MCRQTNAATIFFSQKKLKNFGLSEVHAPEEQQAKLFRLKNAVMCKLFGLVQVSAQGLRPGLDESRTLKLLYTLPTTHLPYKLFDQFQST